MSSLGLFHVIHHVTGSPTASATVTHFVLQLHSQLYIIYCHLPCIIP